MSVAFYQRTCAKLRDKSKPKRFSFWFWAQFWLAFSTKIFVLSVLLSVAVYGFSLFWHLVFSFQQQPKRFFGFAVQCGFSVSYSCYSVFGFFVFCLHAMAWLRGMHDKPEWPHRVVALLESNYALDHGITKSHRGHRGKKWLRMKVMRQLWTVSLSYEEGKGGENFGKRNKFRCKFNKEERSLQKLKNSVW